MTPNKQKELQAGLVLNYLVTAVGLLSSLLFNPIIIRALGQNEYGLYETIGSFVNYLAVLDLGFSAVVVRYTAKYEAEGETKQRDEFLYRAQRIYQYLSLAILVGGTVLYCMLDFAFGNSFAAIELRKAKKLFLLVLGTTVLSVYGQVYTGAMTGVGKFVLPRIIRIAKVVLGKIVAILVITMGADSIGYTAVLFVFEAVSVIVNRGVALKHVSFTKCRVRFSEVKELLVFTGFIFLQAIASQLYWQIDKLILGAMVGTAVVAIYSVAMNLHNIVQNVSTSIKDVLLPKATQIAIKDQNPAQIQNFMIRAGRLVVMVYGLALVCLTVLGKEFIFLWLGQEYLEAYTIYLVLGYAGLMPCVLSIGETVCRAYNKHQFLSYVSLGAALINAVLTFIFVKQWGMLGAVSATAIGLVVANTIIPLWYYKKSFDLTVFQYCWRIFARIVPIMLITACVGMGMRYFLNTYSWMLLIIETANMCAFFFALLLLFGMSSQERQIVKGRLNKLLRKKSTS